jgi:hypothetical protein
VFSKSLAGAATAAIAFSIPKAAKGIIHNFLSRFRLFTDRFLLYNSLQKYLLTNRARCVTILIMPYKDQEKQAECKKTWDEEHPENYKQRQQKYRQSHKPELAARRKLYNRDNPDVYLFHAAKSRAKKYNIPFNITREDVIIPTHCPVFGFPLEHGDKGFHENSPSIDQIIPEKGYTKGNIVVVSFKANRMKQNATVVELEQLAAFYRKLEASSEPASSL